MGERNWYYIITNKKNPRVSVFYDSWSYDIFTLRKMGRLIRYVEKIRTSFEWAMEREIESIVQGTVPMAPGCHCPISTEKYNMDDKPDVLFPENVDSNYGYVVVDLRDQKNIKFGLFSNNHEYKYLDDDESKVDWVKHRKNLHQPVSLVDWVRLSQVGNKEEYIDWPKYKSGEKKFEPVMKRVEVMRKPCITFLKKLLREKCRTDIENKPIYH